MLLRLFTATFSALAVLSTVVNRLLVATLPVCPLDFSSGLPSPLTVFGFSATTLVVCVPLVLVVVSVARHLLASGHSCLSTCMSNQGPQDDGTIELTLTFRDLHITVRGPSDQATALVSLVTARGSQPSASAVRSTSPVGTDLSFDLVGQSDPLPFRVLETRDQICASFDPCPQRLLDLGNRLSGSRLDSASRIRRAWVAGQWAKAVLEERVPTPNKSEAIEIRPRFYAVVRCADLDCPVIFQSSGSYWRAIRSFEGSSSVSHSFPSETEARTYLSGAGFSGFSEDIAVRP